MTEEAKEARKAYYAEYREKNRQRIRETAGEWRRKNQEKIKSYRDKYWNSKAAV